MVSPLHRGLNGLLAGELRVNRTLTDPESNHGNKNDDADGYAKRIVGVK